MIDLRLGDCLDVLATLDAGSVHAVVTDPPYGIGFMGREWDSFAPARVAARAETIVRKGTERTSERWPTKMGGQRQGGGAAIEYDDKSLVGNRRFQAWCEAWAAECLRVLKPGGHLVSFGGTRTYHRLAAGIEDAGFEIRDSLMWVFGSGFPKSHNVGCRCDDSRNGDGELRGVRKAVRDVPATTPPGKAADLFSDVQREDPRTPPSEVLGEYEGAEEKGSAPRLGESSVERRGDLPAPARELCAGAIRAGADVGSADGPEGRVRDGAPARDGDADPSAADAGGGSPSPQSRPARQPARESRALADEPGPQAGGGWSLCPRCGKPTAGLGTALKPGYEPIVLARKPLAGTVAGNVAEHGAGALDIDACRIPTDDPLSGSGGPLLRFGGSNARPHNLADDYEARGTNRNDEGRWPANVILNEEAAELLDEQTGVLTSGANPTRRGSDKFRTAYGDFQGQRECEPKRGIDVGGASRFFYCAKTSRAERNAGLDGTTFFNQVETVERQRAPLAGALPAEQGEEVDGLSSRFVSPARNHHPTVKPIALMRWLTRLVTPPAGTVLDPFLGSGTTAIAAALESFNVIGIEREPDYLQIARARVAYWTAQPVEAA